MHIWDLRVASPAVSYQELEGHTGNISCLCYSASGLLVSQATWAPGRSLFLPDPQGCRPLCSSLSSGMSI